MLGFGATALPLQPHAAATAAVAAAFAAVVSIRFPFFMQKSSLDKYTK